ncbi:MAG: hypothetical protein HY260_06815 [Chloroflexi bacterium]|nr:hypothetical protein [Chloroflexota bacterium]
METIIESGLADKLALALSLFNTLAALWLGLTVLLSGDRRHWPVIAGGSGLLLSAMFFLSHTIILSLGVKTLGPGMEFWWRLTWLPAGAAPLAWYLVNRRSANLTGGAQGWDRFAPYALAGLGAAILALMIAANPFVDYSGLVLGGFLTVRGPLDATPLVWLYVVYVVLCYGLSLLAMVRRQAQRAEPRVQLRARPWLIGINGLLLAASFIVGFTAIWTVRNALPIAHQDTVTFGLLRLADFVVTALISATIILLGRAVLSYEVFTERPLPRRGFFRHWRSVVLLTIGTAFVVMLLLKTDVPPIYSLTLLACLAVGAYALFTWRSYQDQQKFVTGLRPFVASLPLSDRLLGGQPGALSEANRLLEALCEDALGAAGATLTLTSESPRTPLVITYRSPRSTVEARGAGYDLTLQTVRGPAGVLRLGPKIDGTVYTAEEIDLARAAAERLLDRLAGEQVVGILMELLRHRASELKTLGARHERVIHEDVLPRLADALENLQKANHAGSSDLVSLTRSERDATLAGLTEAHRTLSALVQTTAPVHPALDREGLTAALRATVESEFADQFERVTWRVDRALEAASPESPTGIPAEIVYHAVVEAVRNAARHGRGDDSARPLALTVTLRHERGLWAVVEDDGVGLLQSRLLHRSVESGKRGLAGSDADEAAVIGGHGLLFHSTLLAVLGGHLSVLSRPQGGCRVEIWLPESALRAPDRAQAGG